jgi:anti-sigma B factor antagonist
MSSSNDFLIDQVGDVIVILPGPRFSALDNADLVQSRSAMLAAIQKLAVPAVIVDFSQLAYFGSIWLDTLCVLWKQVRERSGTMALCSLSETSLEILTRTKLASLWPIYASRQDALDARRRARPPGKIDPSADSRLFHKLRDDLPSCLQVQETGRRTVVGFTGGDLPPEHVLSRYLDQITTLIDEHDCREFAFDLAGVATVPTGFLGVVATILKKGVRVSVVNSSAEIREVLALSNLDRRVQVEEFK